MLFCFWSGTLERQHLAPGLSRFQGRSSLQAWQMDPDCEAPTPTASTPQSPRVLAKAHHVTRLTPMEVGRICESVKRGIPMKHLALRYHVDRKTIWRLVRRYGHA